jgi:3-oxoacyl-[acyl-carrier protein] reductase
MKVIRIYNSTTPEARINCLDIGNIEDLEEILVNLEKEYGNLEIDFVGAASMHQSEMFVSLNKSKIKELLATGVDSYVYVTKTLLKYMIRSKYGRLVFLSSFRSVHMAIGTSLYSATKAFGETLFTAIGKEYGRMGISSSVIRMGYFDGKMLDVLKSKGSENIPVSLLNAKVGTSEDLCSSIRFIFNSPMTNGGIIELDGGLHFG